MAKSPHDATPAEKKAGMDWDYVRRLIPFIWKYKARAGIAVALLILAKVVTVAIPMVLKEIVDTLDKANGAAVALPLGMLLAYGGLRLGSSMFRELQTIVFTRVRYGIMRRISIQLLGHLHALSLRFHLERKTGELTRDIDRGTNSVSTLLNYLLFNIVPTFVEVTMVAAILVSQYDWRFGLVTLVTLVLYVGFTFIVTGWRMKFRREMQKRDSKASSVAIDSLLNFETVKTFGNDQYEIAQFDENLSSWENMATRVQASLSVLNAGQALIIAAGVTVTMIMAANEVAIGKQSIGDLVAVNAYLLQLFLPLGFLGTVYSILKNAASDMERMFNILDREPEIQDKEGSKPLVIEHPDIEFENVSFYYEIERPILHDVSVSIPAGSSLAIVGPSGSGKSTLGRLLFRFYDIQSGRITVDGFDIRDVTQRSLRKQIGIVPQDTVLFNDTIYHNIAYGDLTATRQQVEEAARMAHLETFIDGLPEGYDTIVGERGLKLSGGEKQRVAIARAILKNPPIVIFDEATSSLDSESEKAILDALQNVATDRTTISIAHRLSTIVDSDQILVMEAGKVVETGTHNDLIHADGKYAELWALQQADELSEN